MYKEWTSVDEAIQWIHRLEMQGIKPGLKRMEWMLARLNHPERRLKFIHIGGTNGKGSTLSFMRHVLQEAGYDVGSFTSPYLIRFQNRIQVNGQDISDQDLLQLAQKVKPLADELANTELGSPTEFEMVTIIALLYFATVSYPDYVLWEVGLGGRLDSTNVVTPILSVITNVGHDHIHILGNTIEQIAEEKAGIIKSGVPIVTGAQDEALTVIQTRAQEQKATLYSYHQSFDMSLQSFDQDIQVFDYQSMFRKLERLEIRMKGAHQLDNAALALMALELLKQYYAVIWEEEHLRQGLKNTFWMGRMEKLRDQPLVMIDGAHNPEGIQALTQTIKQYFSHRPVTLIFSALQKKNASEMLEPLDEIVQQIVVTTFDFPRAASVEAMLKHMEESGHPWKAEYRGEEDWQKAYQSVINQVEEDDVVIITGSLYFISAVRQSLKQNE